MRDTRDEPMRQAIDRIVGECIAVRLRMLNRVVTNMYDDALRPLGVKFLWEGAQEIAFREE